MSPSEENLGKRGDDIGHIAEGPSGAMPQADDVMCVVKHYMRDERPAQVLRVLCAGASDIVSAQPLSIVPRKPKENLCKPASSTQLRSLQRPNTSLNVLEPIS